MCKDKKDAVGITKESSSGFKIVLALLLAVLFVVLNAQEYNARKILSYGEGVEKVGKYEVSLMAYRVLIEKYPLSFSVIPAREGLLRIESETGMTSDERLRETFFEKVLGRRGDPYIYYMFPVVICGVCVVVLILLFLKQLVIRMWMSSFWTLPIILIAACLTIAQFVGMVDDSIILTNGVVSPLMENPLWLYYLSYVLVAFVVMVLFGSDLNKKVVKAEV